MRRAPSIELTAAEREVLEKTVRCTTSAVRDVFRARIVLLAAKGSQSRDIAAELDTGQDTVSKWRRRFDQRRLEGLIDRPGRGRKRHYDDQSIERIVEDTLHSTPEQATHWSTRTMAKHAGVSHTTVQRIWHAHELKPHLLHTFKLSNDKRFVEKLRDVIGLYVNPPEHALVLCVDEKSQIQALDRPQPGLPMKKGRAGTMTHDYKRHGTTTLFAALNVLEGTVIGIVTNLQHEAERAGVQVERNSKVDRALVDHEQPDAVVLATGARPREIEIEGAQEAHVVDAWQVLKGEANVGTSVVIADWRCDWIGLGLAEKLTRDGCRVRLCCNGYYARPIDPAIRARCLARRHAQARGGGHSDGASVRRGSGHRLPAAHYERRGGGVRGYRHSGDLDGSPGGLRATGGPRGLGR